MCERCVILEEENKRLRQQLQAMFRPHDYGLDERARDELADFYGPDFADSQLKKH